MIKSARSKPKAPKQSQRSKPRAAARKPTAKAVAKKKAVVRRKPSAPAPSYFGVYAAIVTNIVDPENQGRIQVKLAFLGKRSALAWAKLVTPYAGEDQGIEILPSVDSEVVVAFQAGDVRSPYIVGACWNGQTPPESADAANNKQLWKSRAKSLFEFDDTQGAEKVTLSMQSGHTLVLSNATQDVKLVHANGSVITLTADGRVQVQANAMVEIAAPALNVHCPAASFDGIVNCETLVASSGVISPAYSPGAGNIW
ncbi:MAG TPA: phage baseplate assembly protein V [Micropepsaceae bacterium]|nr:phage baseplate assembly protein V [Micropepsaceae bacterium]